MQLERSEPAGMQRIALYKNDQSKLADFNFLSAVEHVPLVELMYLVFTRMPDESYCRQLRSSFLSLCDDFRALINSSLFFSLFSSLFLFLSASLDPRLRHPENNLFSSFPR